MTPLCKVEVTLPRVLGSREVRRGGVDEQTGVAASVRRRSRTVSLKVVRVDTPLGDRPLGRGPAPRRSSSFKERRTPTVTTACLAS
jgi:hypothetical protein